MPAKTRLSYEFGPFRLIPGEKQLLCNSDPVPLTPKAFDTLLLLVENHGTLITKEEFLQKLWPDSFVEEVALPHNISQLRKALKEGSNELTLIETVPKRGYRFIGSVREVNDGGPGLEAEAAIEADHSSPDLGIPNQDLQPSHLASKPSLAEQWSPKIAWVVMFLVVAAGLVLTAFIIDHKRSAASTADIRSIAVLPLANLSGDPEQEYFTDGMTDELITDLARLGSVRVISRTSSMRYKRAQKSLPEIANELNVDAIVEGSVQSSSGRLHLTAQLIQARPEKHLWAQSYDRPLGDAVVLQEELARSITRAIHASITPEQQALLAPKRNVSPEAYQLYLKGRYFWNRRTEDGLMKAIDYFQQAISKEPDYAPAYSGLADSYNLLHFYGGLAPEELVPKARAAAQKALALDDGLAEAHTSLAYLTHRFDWDWATAEKEYKRALELNPNYATTHHWYAEYLMVKGRFPEAEEQLQKAKELDPLSLEINTDEGLPFYFTRQYDQAIKEYQQVVQMDPSFAQVHFALRDVYELQGRLDDAVKEFRKGAALSGGSDLMVEPVARALAERGPRGYWQKRLDLALHGPRKLRATPAQIANLYAALGDNKHALEWLGKAYALRDDELTWLAVEPWHDGLRSEPAFIELAHRVGLAP